MTIRKLAHQLKTLFVYDADKEFYAKIFPDSVERKDLIRVRRMNKDDLTAVLTIEGENYKYPWSESIFNDCLKSSVYSCWVCCEDANIIGYSIVSMAACEAHIMNISVTPSAQNIGVGKVLLEHMITIASKKAGTLFLEVRPSNKAAISLYQKRGFNEIGLRKGYYPTENGGREDAIVLALELISL